MDSFEIENREDYTFLSNKNSNTYHSHFTRVFAEESSKNPMLVNQSSSSLSSSTRTTYIDNVEDDFTKFSSFSNHDSIYNTPVMKSNCFIDHNYINNGGGRASVHNLQGKAYNWDFNNPNEETEMVNFEELMEIPATNMNINGGYDGGDDGTSKKLRKVIKSQHKITVKGQWTTEEDMLLAYLVKNIGIKKWSKVATKMKGRIGKQCRERWHNHLKPNIKKAQWTEEEDKMLIKEHKILGNRWAEIANRLPNRSENTIKNHWNATKRRQWSKRGGKATKNKSTLLQHYIRSLVIPPTAEAGPSTNNRGMESPPSDHNPTVNIQHPTVTEENSLEKYGSGLDEKNVGMDDEVDEYIKIEIDNWTSMNTKEMDLVEMMASRGSF